MKLSSKLLALFGFRKRSWVDELIQPKNRAERLAKRLGVAKVREFKPHVFHHKELDWLYFNMEDVTTVTCPTKDPNIEILYHGYEPDKIVGVKILDWSKLKPR